MYEIISANMCVKEIRDFDFCQKENKKKFQNFFLFPSFEPNHFIIDQRET